MHTPFLRICIIGSGLSGSLLAHFLQLNLKKPSKIIIFEREPRQLFRGIAYSSDLPYEPLNVPAGKMSLYPEKPMDFHDWLQKNNRPAEAHSFVSRRWFGDYLVDRITKTPVNPAVHLETITGTVVDIKKAAAAYELSLQEGGTYPADIVVLATGHEPSADILKNWSGITTGHYHPNPWKHGLFKSLKTTDKILFIGSGLTMIDIVSSLKKAGHTGQLYAVSRNGTLPEIHAPTQAYALSCEMRHKNLDELIELVPKELARAAKQGATWHSVVDALRPHTNILWQNLNIHDKRKFLQTYRSVWEKHRHRMPIESGNIIRELQKTGQLKLLKGEIAFIANTHAQELGIKIENGKKITDLSVNTILNCTGPSTAAHSTNLLLKQLFKNGDMVIDECEIGILTGTNGEILKNDGKVLENCFALGPLRRGTEWETTALHEIREQALALTHLISNYAVRTT